MKGAAVGHGKQRIIDGHYLGVSEPGIIAAEPPNPIVNDLVILPDIEKRLESFVRIAHAVVVFPGGAGTLEEIFFLLGVLLCPDNTNIPLPLIFTGPKSSEAYFNRINRFVGDTLGPEAQTRYKIIIDDPLGVAREVQAGIRRVREFRKGTDDAYYFNWLLKIDPEFQKPFTTTHDSVSKLELHKDLEKYLLATNLRRLFSSVVAGNVKDEGIRTVEQHGPFEIYAEHRIAEQLDSLLASFVEQQRMRLPGTEYTASYRIIKKR